MRKKIALLGALLLLASCSSQVKEVKKFDLKYEVGQVTLPKDTLLPLKNVKVKAEFNEVPLSVVLKAVCKEKNLSCDFTDFSSSIPITLKNFSGTLYDLLKLLEKKTGYRFSYEGNVLTVVNPHNPYSERLEKEYQQRKLKTEGPRVTLNLAGVPLFVVFNEINKNTPFTVVPDQNVDLSRKVFVSVKDLPLDKALETILYPLGYSYEINPKKREIYVSALETRVFKIPYIPKKVEFSYKAGEGTEGASSSTSSTPAQGGGEGAGKVVEISTDFWEDLEKNLKNIVSKRGNFFVNKTARLVTVTDTPDNLRKVEKVINSLIASVSEKVQFRVAIYELTYSDEYKSGIDWSAVFKGTKLSFKALGDSSSYFLKVEGNFNPFGYLKGILSRFGKVKTIFDNYVRTKSGETVAIVPAETYRYLERVEVQSQADTGLVTRTPVFGELSLGIQVYVTPTKKSENEVEYEVAITNRFLKSVREYTFDGSTYIEPERIGKTQVSLSTIIPRGTFEVITGIKNYRMDYDSSGIPLLKDVPVAGELFGSVSRNARVSEYIIAIYTY